MMLHMKVSTGEMGQRSENWTRKQKMFVSPKTLYVTLNDDLASSGPSILRGWKRKRAGERDRDQAK